MQEESGRRFPWLVAQLGLVLAVMHRFGFQAGFGFHSLIPLLFGGFVVHGLLPPRFRHAFFALLSIASVLVVLPFPHSFTLVGLGLGLIGICHLPLPFALRVWLLVGCGAALAAVRGGWLRIAGGRELETLVLPVLGAMFMFRLAVYMYDLRHEKQPASIWERLSFFFMLPNVCFLLFPVVDYKTYRRSHYQGEAHDIYQRGITWMYRGMTHLIAYRLVYQVVLPAPEEVRGLGGVVLFVVATYLLYLRISGQFHIIVGILCLFGFNLPRTHRLYYLASSFNDFWRRINIYWKDFMLKMFFYPVYMHFRAGNMALRLSVATLVVFFATWILHSYQWFWIRGSFPLTAKDGVFWGVLGVLVTLSSLREARGTKKSLSKRSWDLRQSYGVAIKTLGTFLVICLLWSLWSAPSIAEWRAMMAQAGTSSASAWLLLLAGMVCVLHLGLLLRYAHTPGTPLNAARVRLTPSDPKLGNLFGCGVLLLLAWLPELGGEASRPMEIIASLRSERTNKADSERAERGYYEGLNDAGSFTSQPEVSRSAKPAGREWLDVRRSDISRMTGDLLEYELVPSLKSTWKDAPFVTNAWGMHDQPYTQRKPEGAFRIALIGASMEVAAGVELDQTYEALIENRLNQELAGRAHHSYEILNFAVGGYSMVQKLLVVRDRVPAFQPDLVLLTLHATEERRLHNHLANVIAGSVTDPFLDSILAGSAITLGMEESDVRRLLPAVTEVALQQSMSALASECRAAGIPVMTVFLPLTDDSDRDEALFETLKRLTLAADLRPIWIRDAFEGVEAEGILLAPRWDPLHLNAKGNQLLADALYPHLMQQLALRSPR